MPYTDQTWERLAAARQRLAAKVLAGEMTTARGWNLAWEVLAQAWADASADLVAAATDGRWPTQAEVFAQRKVADALAQTAAALDDLTAGAATTAAGVAADAVSAVPTDSASIIVTQLPPVAAGVEVAARLADVPLTPLTAIVERTRTQIEALHLPLSDEATAAMRAELVRGVALGKNPREAAARMVALVEGRFYGGLGRALNISRTEILDAYRYAAQATDEANADVLAGWTWIATLDTRTCPSCLAQHGSVHKTSEFGPNDHQQGRCARAPKAKSWKDLGFDIDEPEDTIPDARGWFDALPESTQRDIMGPERLRLLRTGGVSWEDLSTRRTTPAWRDSQGVTPVSALRARAAS